MRSEIRKSGWVLLGMLCLAVWLLGSVTVSAESQGRLTLYFHYNGEPLQGISFRVYRVASLGTDGAGAAYVPLAPFRKDAKGETVRYEGMSTEESIAAAAWFSTLTSRAAGSVSGTSGSDGRAVISGLEDGMYLIVQTDSSGAEGIFSPFLVSVPELKKEKSGISRLNEVTAEPKYEKKAIVTPTVTPTGTPGKNTGTAGGGSAKTTVVKTGDTSEPLRYLAFALVALAVVLLLAERRDARKRR